MQYPILVVDKDVKVHEKEQAAWLKHNINTIRVSAMQEAIDRLTKEKFLFTAINADNINYLPLLKAMRNSTSSLIFLIASVYDNDKEIVAYKNGADAYALFQEDSEKNIQLALSLLLRHNERDKQPRRPSNMIFYENFLVIASMRKIFYNDECLQLTKKEYEILHYLIANHDITVTHEKIYRKVWGGEISESSRKVLWNFINKLRKKIVEQSGGYDYFKTEREIGYRFTAESDKKYHS